MRIEPLFDKVILEREKLKSGSIIIPQSVEKRNAPAIGKVIAVGAGCQVVTEEMVGKRVIFGIHAGDSHLGKEPGKLAFHLFGADAEIPHV